MLKFILRYNSLEFRKLFKKFSTVVFYVSSTILKAAAQIVSIFLIARLIDPEDLGLWTFVNIFVTYAAILNIGTISGLNRELPYNMGRGEMETAYSMVAVVSSYIIFTAFFILIGGTLFSFTYIFGSFKIFAAILAGTLISSLTLIENFLLATYRSNNSFNQLSKAQIAQTILNLLTLVLIYFYNFLGLIFKTVVTQLVYVIILYYNRPVRTKPKWDKKIFLEVVKVGLPIYILACIQSFASTFDRLWLMKLTDKTQLGYYSFGMYAFIAITLIPISLSGFIYPKLTYKYGQSQDSSIQWQYFKKITVSMLFILIPIAIIGWVVGPEIIERFFPKYILGLDAFKILLIASVFMGCTVGSNIMLSMKKWKYIVIYQLSYALLLIIMPLTMSFFWINKISGIAIGVMLAYIIIFLINWIVSYLATHESAVIS